MNAAESWPHPTTATKAHFHPFFIDHLQFSIHFDGNQSTKRARQTQTIAASTVLRIEDLQVLQPWCLFQPRLL